MQVIISSLWSINSEQHFYHWKSCNLGSSSSGPKLPRSTASGWAPKWCGIQVHESSVLSVRMDTPKGSAGSRSCCCKRRRHRTKL
eukprot:12933496-Prorocentrum_lima.AAC.1